MRSIVLFGSVLLFVFLASADPALAQSCAGLPNGFPCNDGNVCTIGTICISQSCVGGVPLPDGQPCDDGVFCNGSDTCQAGTCVSPGDPCDGPDGDGDCSESCSEAAGACTLNDPDGATCDDGNSCTSSSSCFDGSCSLSLNTDDGTPCDSDGIFCNGAEECQTGSCVSPGDPCDGADGDGDCSETCLEAAQTCNGSDPDGSACDDGNICTTGDACQSGTCTLSLNKDDGTPCGDGTFCNGSEACQSGTCVSPGDPCVGPDGDGDCSESCDEVGDVCSAPDPNGSTCDDNNACTTGDACQSGACTLALNQDDGTPCGDGTFCNGSEACQSGTCVSPGDPCVGPDGDGDCSETCDEAADACTAPDPNGGACDDGAFCNGSDTCQSGACTGLGDPCDGPDGDADCTESCSEASDACTAPDPDSAVCDGGQFVGGKFLFEVEVILLTDLTTYSQGDVFQVAAVFSDPAAPVGGGDAVANYIPGSVTILVNGSPVASVADPELRYLDGGGGTSVILARAFPSGINAEIFADAVLSVAASPPETFLDLFPLDESSPEVLGTQANISEDGMGGQAIPVSWSVAPLPSAGAVPDGVRVAGVPLTLAHSAGPGDLDLSWGTSCAVTDDDYAVYEGVLGDFPSHVPVANPNCTTGGATMATITPGGGDHYYLVVPTGGSGLCEGSYGFDSDGAPRPQSLSACATQSVSECGESQRKTVFVTSATYNGNFGTLANADANCQSLADAAGLGGAYKAWLSDSATDVRDRFTQATTAYVRVDGAVIADDWADLVDNPSGDPLLAPIDRDENGTAVGIVNVWTGSTFAGQVLAAACSDWTDGTNASQGRTGRTSRVDLGWTSLLTVNCNNLRALYCFEQ